MDTLEFITHLLPSQGYYCLFTKQNGARNLFFEDIPSMVETAMKLDQRGIDVYHACATFKEATRRTAENAAFVSSFWLDIDVGEKKGPCYVTLKAAWEAFKQFSAKVDLPRPTIVKSGGGLHIYYPYHHDKVAADALPAMNLLKETAKRMGLRIDPSRTGDLASVLRPIGTHNYKYDPIRDVELVSA
jgi:hypothetical protein